LKASAEAKVASDGDVRGRKRPTLNVQRPTSNVRDEQSKGLAVLGVLGSNLTAQEPVEFVGHA
jgi:hypothetical protein